MSAKTLPREMGCWISCDGTDDKGCPTNERRFTAVILIGNNRSFLLKDGWGRGLRTGYKRRDLCKSCMTVERQLFKDQQAKTEEWKRQRAENRKARIEERRAEKAAQPKKPRKRKAAALPEVTHSPSADSAPAPAT